MIGIAIAIPVTLYQVYSQENASNSSQPSLDPDNNFNSSKSDSEIEPIKSPKTKSINAINDAFENIDFDNDSVAINLAGRCGYLMDDFYQMKTRTDISKMSSSQIDAYERIEDMCMRWFDHLSQTDVNQIKKKRKQWEKQNEPYLDVFNETSNQSTLASASEQLKKGIDKQTDLRLLESQLVYLLHKDTELQLKIGEVLETRSLEFIRSLEGAIYTTQLTLCKYSDCSSNSMFMTETCMSFDQYCGLSVQQYLQSILTYSQFTDWQNAADVLYRLIETNWFSERETLNPKDP